MITVMEIRYSDNLILLSYNSNTNFVTMFGNFEIADLIAYYFATIDNYCRKELYDGHLVSERDYVTALSTRIRDFVTTKLKIACHSQTVRPTAENENGVDGIIVFGFGDEIKAGIFEAKRPQIFKVNKPHTVNIYTWDVLTKRNISHFSEQIEKQHIWKGSLAIWEMFFNDGPNGFNSPPFEYFGSSCLWHNSAYGFMHSQKLIFKPWTTKDLEISLSNSCISFYQIIFDLLSCKEGKRFKIDNQNKSARIFSLENDNISIELPLPLGIFDGQDQRIEQFLLNNGLESYTYIDLNDLKANNG